MKKSIIIFLILGFLVVPKTVLALSETEIANIAQTVFENNVPLQYRDEYKFTGTRNFQLTDYPNVREFNYARVKDNIAVSGDNLYIWIDVDSGKVIQKYFPPAYYPITVDTTPVLTQNQAKYIAEKSFSGAFSIPRLIIKDEKLLYKTSGGGKDIGVDSNTGDVIVLSVALESSSSRPVPVKFESSQYLAETGDVVGSLFYVNNLYKGVPLIALGIIATVLLYANRNTLLKLVK